MFNFTYFIIPINMSVCLSVHRLEDYVVKEVIVAEEKQVRHYVIHE